MAAICCLYLSGCVAISQPRTPAEKNLAPDSGAAIREQCVLDHYQVGCPDVLTIDIASSPATKLRKPVGADGRIDLGKDARPRVEGRSPMQIAALVADELGAAPQAVRVQVAEYRSQQVFLFGKGVGGQRSVPYRGQETVLDLLRRTAGVNVELEPNDVYVVRAHIAEGGRPEVFAVQLQAIVNGDQKTNLRLLPNDQIYVGETRQERLERALPPWLRTLLHK